MAVTITINGVDQTSRIDLRTIDALLPGSNTAGELRCVLDDPDRQVTLAARQTVVLADGATTLWRGLIVGIKAEMIGGAMRRFDITARDYGVLLDDSATINQTFAAGTTEQSVLTTILSGTGLTVTGDANSALAQALTIQAQTRRQAIERLIEAIGATRYYWVDSTPQLVYRATALGAAPYVLVDGAPTTGQTDYELLEIDTDATSSGTATTRGRAIVVGADGWLPGQTVTVNSTALGLTNATYYLAEVRLEFESPAVRRWTLGLGAPGRSLATALASAPALPPPRIDSIAQFAASIRPPAVVSALPTLPNGAYPAGSLAYLTTDGKLYKTESGTAWEPVVAAVDLDGQITSTQISDGAISTPKLAALAVTAEKIAASAITTDKLAADSVTAGAIAAGAVGASEIAAGAITAEKISTRAFHAGLWRGSVRNLVPNPGFEDPLDGTDWSSNFSRQTWVPRSGLWSAYSTNVSGSNKVFNCARFAVAAGRRYRVRCWARGQNANNNLDFNATLSVRWFDASLTSLGDTTIAQIAVGKTNTYQKLEGVAVSPNAAAYAYVLMVQASDSAPGLGEMFADDFEMYELDEDVDHAGGDVKIDSTGVTITNGKLTFVDNYGATAMDGGGFGDAWQDFIRAGVYNGNFSRVSGGAAAGWAITNGTYPLSVVTGTGWGSGNAIQYAPTAASTVDSTLTSDMVTVTGRQFIRVSTYWTVVSGTGTIEARLDVSWYTAAKALISTTAGAWTAVPNNWFIESDVLSPPAGARYFRVQVRFRCTAGSGTVQLRSVAASDWQTTTEFLPPGAIVAWTGASPPAGWRVCDGTGGTPDLTDRMIVGGTSTASGGSVSPTSALPTHSTHASGGSHSHALGNSGGPSSSVALQGGGSTNNAASTTHVHALGTSDTTGGHTHDAHSAHSIYKYYRLIFIMKL